MTIVKDYNDVGPIDRIRRSELWVRVLGAFCMPDEVGNRPCDWGCPCDKCHYDYDLQKRYVKRMIAQNIPITQKEYDKYIKDDNNGKDNEDTN